MYEPRRIRAINNKDDKILQGEGQTLEKMMGEIWIWQNDKGDK